MSGGKGGSQTSSVVIPEYIEAAAQRNLNRADRIGQIGNVVNPGPTSVGFVPMQSSSFQNTADTANAFGLNTPSGQSDIQRGGMDAPQEYANGVSGYSSAPIYDQSMQEFGQRDPAQKSYIDSMFIDKQNGDYAYDPMDYNQFSTNAQNSREGAAEMQAEADREYQRKINVTDSNQAHNDAMLDASRRGGNGFGGNGGDMYVDYTPTYMDPYGDPAPSMQPNRGLTGGYTGVMDTIDGGGPNASTLGGRDFAGPNPDGSAGNDGSGGGGDGCVVATHAVESGAFTPHMKREAVVWCMSALHGKWWGEAVRRGYRHLATRKIEQGKAREHYAEFRQYIAFASGKKRDLRGALTFITRTAQFFAVGIIKRGA